MHRNLECYGQESRQIGSGQQEMARVNINILGINDLRWTGMDKLNSDDRISTNVGKNPLEETE